MKSLVMFFAAFFTLAVHAQASLAAKSFSLESEINVREEIEKLYLEQFGVSGSPLNLAVLNFAAENEAVFDFDGENPVLSVNHQSSISSYFGKSGAGFATSNIIVPIWLSFPGTGLIEELSGWMVVKYDTNFAEGTRVLTIERIISFSVQ